MGGEGSVCCCGVLIIRGLLFWSLHSGPCVFETPIEAAVNIMDSRAMLRVYTGLHGGLVLALTKVLI